MIGYAAVAAALAVSLYGVVAALAGVRRRDVALVRSARVAAYVNFGLLTVANLAMIYGLVTHDFSISYVAQVGSRATPLFYTVISLWSALEGSILFWGWVLALYTAAAVFLADRKLGTMVDYANATLLGIGAFFYLLLVGPANPFGAVFPVPADGPGPNPLLQNHILMGVHPPLLYLGYVGMSVPFAFAMGALLSGRLDDQWLRVTRRWTVASWGFLSLAIIAGMWWSYDVLGWGGYWAWDPVENASFMPWLTATAFLHSAMVQERRQMLRVWNLGLISATFLLTILGTFLTRSGVLSSVHAFSEGTIGYYFLGFIAVALLLTLALLAGRSSELRRSGSIDEPISREGVFLVNNLLLTAFTFTVLLGTLFPLVAEAFRGVKLTVGAPFFNRMTVPICAALIFLMGVGPVLPWRGGRREDLVQRFALPFGLLLAAVAVAYALGTRGFWALAAFGFAAFALGGNVREFLSGAAARRRAHGEAALTALWRLVRANNRRYGGYIAHMGVIALTAGIAASSEFRAEREVTLRPGETVGLEGYTVRFDQVRAWEEPHRWVVAAEVTAFENGRELGGMSPRLNFYDGRQEPITTPAVRSRPDDDLYLTLLAFDENGANATFSIIVEPMVFWIWAGGLIIAIGAIVALLPRRRRVARVQVPPVEEPLAVEVS